MRCGTSPARGAARGAAALCAVVVVGCAWKAETLRDTSEPPGSQLPDASTGSSNGASGSVVTGATDAGVSGASGTAGADVTGSIDSDASESLGADANGADANGPDAGAGDGAVSRVGCGPAGSLMYLLTDTGVLTTFDPALLPGVPDPSNVPAGAFHALGSVSCTFADGTTSVPIGDLAADEAGGLWANEVTGQLVRINADDVSCTGTAFDPGPTGFTKMGMTVLGQPDGGELLYVADNSAGPLSAAGLGLATIDLTTFQFSLVGNFGEPLTGRVAELAATASGRLYGFFLGADTPSWFAEIDPASGALITSVELPVSISGVGQTHVATAAALWDNKLYFFITNTSNAPWADVYTYDLAVGTTTQVLSQIGFNVTGAAVIMCGATAASE